MLAFTLNTEQLWLHMPKSTFCCKSRPACVRRLLICPSHVSHAVSGVGYELYHCTITYESSGLIWLRMSE